MKKILILSMLLTRFITSNGQDLRLLENFDRITMREQRYNVEGQVASMAEFSLRSEEGKSFDAKNFSHITYENRKRDEIYLEFYKGRLFDKRLSIYHPAQERSQAKEEYENVKKYVFRNNKIAYKTHQVEKTGTYGETGEGEVYFLSANNTLHKFFRAGFSGVLDISFPHGNVQQFISGYNVIYSYSDFYGVGARIYK